MWILGLKGLIYNKLSYILLAQWKEQPLKNALLQSILLKTKACANEDLTFFAGYIVTISQGTKF